MERPKQKSKKDKPNKYVEKEKSTSFVTDVRTMKENIKIREILRTVKMNSSMRIKAPRGSKVMQNKDFNEDCFENTISVEGQDEAEPASATNTILNVSTILIDSADNNEISKEDCVSIDARKNQDLVETGSANKMQHDIDTSFLQKSKSFSEGLEDCSNDGIRSLNNAIVQTSPAESPARTRKLSLDHTMLTRREGLSQSEVDLHSVGKSPLERKSSFFRKKMDSFLKNTTEIFKRQSKPCQVAQRRDSNCSRMSVSMQSLNENSGYEEESLDKYHELGSVTSLRSATTARSYSSVSMNESDHDRLPVQSEESLAGSQLLDTSSINSLNEEPGSLLNTRAISMSSGLDTANQRRRKTSRSNRVTWLVSESLTDYFRRIIQDEKSQGIQGCHSYQDFSTIPESSVYGPKSDSKGRRLSYMRAVSGEDPALPKYQDSIRRKKIAENEGGPQFVSDIVIALQEFAINGIPELSGFTVRRISDEATTYLNRFSSDNALEVITEFFSGVPKADEPQHAVILELVHTEVDHIRHLKVIADVYLAAAHALQAQHLMVDLPTHNLFLNIPDVLNSNMRFWDKAIFPMLRAAKEKNIAFDTNLMVPGFSEFHEIFESYESYVHNQSAAVDLLREKMNSEDFVTYLTWCNQNSGHRLQLADILVKPMQRLTKYSLIINRLVGYITDETRKREMEFVENYVKSFALRVNRGVRQREEINLLKSINVERYEPNFKGDEDLAKKFRQYQDFDMLSPMLGCGSFVMRCLIHEGDLRFKDHLKEFDARVLLFTDFILICKKYTKANKARVRMVRPRYLLSQMVPSIRPPKGPHDYPILLYVVLDEGGVARDAFSLSETSKDTNPAVTIKIWEQKIHEAYMAYELSKWYRRFPVADLAVVEGDYNSEEFKKSHPETISIERRARERTAAMMHPNQRSSRDSSQEPDVPESERIKGPTNLHDYYVPGYNRYPGFNRRTSSLQTTSYSSQYMSSSELHLMSTSACGSHGSHEELQSSLQRSGASSMDHGTGPDDIPPSITVNAVDENVFETLVPSRLPTPPMLVLQASSPNTSPGGPMSANGTSQGGSENTLRVSPSHSSTVLSSVSQDLNTEVENQPSLPHAASMILYQKHQEQMERNRLAAGHQYLTPDLRGSSYPPPSPTRGSLQRGLAFSYSIMNPRLTRSQNIEHSHFDVQTFAETIFQKPREPQQSRSQRTPSPTGRMTPTAALMDFIEVLPGTSKAKAKSDKQEKKKKKPSILARSTESRGAESDTELLSAYDTDDQKPEDDNRSRRSIKSTKSHGHTPEIPGLARRVHTQRYHEQDLKEDKG